MERNRPTRIAIIGAGNVASHLAPALDSVARVTQIAARSMEHAQRVAALTNAATPITDLALFDPDADIVVVAVNDDSIRQIASSTPDCGLWVHTSGSVPASVFAPFKSRYGVLYPLQTFTEGTPVDLNETPFLVEGSSSECTHQIYRLASQLSRTVVRADSSDRRLIHLAAVMACNFPNRLWAIASELLAQRGLDLSLLKPLVTTTLNKAFAIGPQQAQTGPAARGDNQVVRSHIEALDSDTAQIYRLLSLSINNNLNI